MISRSWLFLIIAVIAGTVLQVSAGVVFFSMQQDEVFLILSAVLYYTGSCCMMAGFEFKIKKEHKTHHIAVLLAFAGIFGLVLFLIITPHLPEEKARELPGKKHSPQLKDRIAVGILIAFAVFCLLGAVFLVAGKTTHRDGDPSRIIEKNEAATFHTIKKIIRAQEKYYTHDYNQDGIYEYAHFPVHLWTTVDSRVHPLRIGLLPKQIASAMGPSLAVNGYYFNFLHVREGSPDLPGDEKLKSYYGHDHLEEIDYTTSWVLAAHPARYGKTGRISFLADKSGQIWARDLLLEEGLKWFPASPEEDGWTIISDRADLGGT